jgi:hypothetical protein
MELNACSLQLDRAARKFLTFKILDHLNGLCKRLRSIVVSPGLLCKRGNLTLTPAGPALASIPPPSISGLGFFSARSAPRPIDEYSAGAQQGTASVSFSMRDLPLRLSSRGI